MVYIFLVWLGIPVNRETAFESPIKGIDKAEYSTTNTEAREKGATTNLLIRFFKRGDVILIFTIFNFFSLIF